MPGKKKKGPSSPVGTVDQVSCKYVISPFLGLRRNKETDKNNVLYLGRQQGYGAFSVSVSQLPETVGYIDHQVEHHRTRTFQEEYLAFLKAHDVKFDEKYLWD